jgi:capsular polysaccharide transport system permease protein
MASLAQGWRIQTRVIQALIIRELTTRFGRENIGFLWVMAEPLLFAVLVGLLWRFEKGRRNMASTSSPSSPRAICRW